MNSHASFHPVFFPQPRFIGMKHKSERSVTDGPPIATISGWEDGQQFTRALSKLDRWELQAADILTVHIEDVNIQLAQDPHSPHLGGYVWLSSMVLCSYLQNLALHHRRDRHEPVKVDDKATWIELGSGVGLMGIMLAKLGVQRVVMTDIEELVDTMTTNVTLNGMICKDLDGREIGTSPPTGKEEGQVVVAPLFWGDKEAIMKTKDRYKPDYILACDCIYSEASAIDLVETMALLCTPTTIIVCMSEVRNQAAQDAFIREAKRLFDVELVPTVKWHGKVAKHIAFDETLNLYRLKIKLL